MVTEWRLVPMKQSLAQLDGIIHDRICGVCTERTVDGKCGLEQPSRCALFRLFPEVVDAIQSVQGDDIRQYIGAIRQSVCSVCPEQLDDGSCEMRQRVGCALD